MSRRLKYVDINEIGMAIAKDADIAKDVLMNDVAPVAEEILRRHIETDIYGAYSPPSHGYERRYSLTRNIISKMVDDTTLLVTSNAQPAYPHIGWASSGDGAFLQMLEVGNLGWWRKGFPRPAISNAQKEAEDSSAIREAIQRGIDRVMGL